MPRVATVSLALLFTAVVFTGYLAKTNAQVRPGGDAQTLPGFRISPHPEAEAPRPAAVKMRPRPAPLAGSDVAIQLTKLGLRSGPITPAPMTIKYQIESYGSSFGAEVDTSTVQDAIFYGATGYVQVDFSVQPGRQYLLDCSLGADGTYKLATMFLLVNNGNTPFLDGTLSSFNRHLLVPMNTAPAGAMNGRVVINFNEIEFYGCQVDTVSQ